WLLGGADLQLARQSLGPGAGSGASGWLLLQPPLRRATALACLPWFLQDLATYGIGLSLPLLLAAAGAAARPAARASALIDLMLVLGISAAIALADRWGRIPLQITGFIGCAAGLALAGLALGPMAPSLPLLALGLALFQFMTNLGPNAQTYLLAGELFPTALRGRGAGLAAAVGKLGAIAAALAMPVLLQRWGPGPLLPLLAVTSLLGAALTWGLRLDTAPPAEPPDLELGSGAS
ncbi:MAG: MFS transporter, partial [Vulcanococcus sp.]